MKIAILGGGISGLSAAWYARKKYPNAEISLLEKKDRLGGWIQTSQENGFLFEQGPRTFAANRSSHLLELIEATGLSSQLIFSDPCADRRFLFWKGKLRSAASFLPMLILPLIREPFISKGHGEDESIYDFAARRLGPKIANTLIDAMALGIFAGDIHKLSIRSCFPFLYKWEQERGSLVLGAFFSQFSNKKKRRKGLLTLHSGMGTLIEELALQSRADIRFETTVETIRHDGVVANGAFYPADLVVSALNGSTIGQITGLWRDFYEADLWIVHLAYDGDCLPKKGFGYLVPTQEGENLLGMIWDSAIFPQQSLSGKTRVTLMMREGSVEEATAVMKRHLGVDAAPIFTSAHLAKAAIPQFYVGYGKRLARFEEEAKKQFPSLILLGNYLRGAAVNACISVSKEYFLG